MTTIKIGLQWDIDFRNLEFEPNFDSELYWDYCDKIGLPVDFEIDIGKWVMICISLNRPELTAFWGKDFDEDIAEELLHEYYENIYQQEILSCIHINIDKEIIDCSPKVNMQLRQTDK